MYVHRTYCLIIDAIATTGNEKISNLADCLALDWISLEFIIMVYGLCRRLTKENVLCSIMCTSVHADALQPVLYC